jgi:AraC family transcriptional regulator
MSDPKEENWAQLVSQNFTTIAQGFGCKLTHSSRELGWSGLLVQKTKSVPQGVSQCSFNHLMVASTASGQFKVGIPGSERLLCGPSDVLIVTPQVAHQGEVVSPMTCSLVFLDESILSEIPQFRGFSQCKELPPALATKDATIRHFISMLADQVVNEGSYGKLYSESLGAALAAYIVHNYLTPSPQSGRKQGLIRRQLDEIDEYISSHIAANVQLQDLANVCGMSRYHFLRLFKESTGVPPHRYLLHWRIAQAKEMLSDPSRAIAEIALSVGFSSQSHFTQTFRKVAGMSPLKYRRGKS